MSTTVEEQLAQVAPGYQRHHEILAEIAGAYAAVRLLEEHQAHAEYLASLPARQREAVRDRQHRIRFSGLTWIGLGVVLCFGGGWFATAGLVLIWAGVCRIVWAHGD